MEQTQAELLAQLEANLREFARACGIESEDLVEGFVRESLDRLNDICFKYQQ